MNVLWSVLASVGGFSAYGLTCGATYGWFVKSGADPRNEFIAFAAFFWPVTLPAWAGYRVVRRPKLPEAKVVK